jgi:hypothetical protein
VQIGGQLLNLAQVVKYCEHSNEPLVSIKDGECLDYLRDYGVSKRQ